MSISKTAFYYKPVKKETDEEIKMYLKNLADLHKRWGFNKMLQKAKLDKKPWNHKRLHRIYCELGLNIRIKPRKRIPKGEATALFQPIKPKVCWSLDFMSDALICGRRFRTLNVIDDYNREALIVSCGFSMAANRVTGLLDELAVDRGYPDMIRVDNGTELTSSVFKEWANDHGILIHYIQPGKPAQNGFIERFNRTYREDVLDMNWFSNLREVQIITKNWIKIYNEERPHESLAGLTPIKFAELRKVKMCSNKVENSTLN